MEKDSTIQKVVKDLEAKYSEQISAVQTKHVEQIKQMTETFFKEKLDLQEKYVTQQSQDRQNYETRFKELSERFESVLQENRALNEKLVVNQGESDIIKALKGEIDEMKTEKLSEEENYVKQNNDITNRVTEVETLNDHLKLQLAELTSNNADTVVKLEQSNKELSEKVTLLESAKIASDTKLEGTNKANEELKAQIEVLKTTVNEQKVDADSQKDAQISDLALKVSHLSVENDKLQSQLEESNEAQTNLHNQIKAAKSHVQELESSKEQLSLDVRKHEEAFNAVNSELEKVQNELKSNGEEKLKALKEVGELKGALDTLRSQNESLESLHSKLSSEYEVLRVNYEEKVKELEVKLAEKETDKSSTESAILDVKMQLEAITKQLEESEGNKKNMNNQINELTKELSELEKTNETLVDEVKNLKADLEDNISLKEDYSTQVEMLKVQIEQANTASQESDLEQEKLHMQIMLLNSKCDTLQNEKETMIINHKNEIESLVKTQDENVKEINVKWTQEKQDILEKYQQEVEVQRQNHVDEVEALKQKQIEEKSQMEKKYDELVYSQGEQSEVMANLKEEREHLQKSVQELESSIRTLKEEKEWLKDCYNTDLTTLNDQLSSAKSSNKQLQKEFETKIKAESESFKLLIESLETENKKLSEQISSLKVENPDVVSVEKHESEKLELQQQYTQYIQQLQVQLQQYANEVTTRHTVIEQLQAQVVVLEQIRGAYTKLQEEHKALQAKHDEALSGIASPVAMDTASDENLQLKQVREELEMWKRRYEQDISLLSGPVGAVSTDAILEMSDKCDVALNTSIKPSQDSMTPTLPPIEVQTESLGSLSPQSHPSMHLPCPDLKQPTSHVDSVGSDIVKTSPSYLGDTMDSDAKVGPSFMSDTAEYESPAVKLGAGFMSDTAEYDTPLVTPGSEKEDMDTVDSGEPVEVSEKYQEKFNQLIAEHKQEIEGTLSY